MYIKLNSGRTAVIGEWPMADETQELTEKGLITSINKTAIILPEDEPITKDDLKETETRILDRINLLTNREN